MASSGPDILSGFGKVSGDYLRSFPGPPVLQGTGAVLTNTGTESALRINRDNFAAGLELAKASLGAKADLTERDMINEQSQWELKKQIEYDKKKNLMETIAGIWNTPTTRKAGDTDRMGQQYQAQQAITPPPSKEELNSSLKAAMIQSLLSDAKTLNNQVEVE
tara:strand:- start:12218 stop:12706 length:489 start_codon:yes stop_codon:yes gene_type:complete